MLHTLDASVDLKVAWIVSSSALRVSLDTRTGGGLHCCCVRDLFAWLCVPVGTLENFESFNFWGALCSGTSLRFWIAMAGRGSLTLPVRPLT